MAVKSSTIKPTKIGSTGPVKGSTVSEKGPQYSHLPGSESYENAQVTRRTVTGGNASAGVGKGRHEDFMPTMPPKIP